MFVKWIQDGSLFQRQLNFKNMDEEKTEKQSGSLKREVGLWSAVSFMISYVIGSGIFVTPGVVLLESGSVGMSFVVWILCGFISFLCCLPFGELSSVVPKSGSIYIYLYTAFNSWHPFFGGLPAFTFFWMMYVIILPCSIALGALLFADYLLIILEGFIGEGRIPEEAFKNIVGSACLVVIGIMNCLSVKLYVKSQDFLSVVKMTAIIVLIASGLYLFASGKALKFNPSFEGTNFTIHGLTRALYFGLFTYDGGCFITNITEEIKKPEKNIMRSILIGLTITTATYVFLNITFLSALTPAEIATGTTVIANFAKNVFGSAGGMAASCVVCLSLLSGIMSGVFYASRIGYVAAREGHLAEFLCCIHKTRQTPAPAVVAQVVLSLLYFFAGGSTGVLIDMYAFFIWMAYGMSMLSVFVLRKQLPDADRPFRVPSVIPVTVGLISCYLFVVSILSGQPLILGTFIICMSLSSSVFYVFIYKKLRFENLGRFQKKLQELLGLVLPSEEPTF